MTTLLEAVTELVSHISPAKVRSLAIEIMALSGKDDVTKLSGWPTTPHAKRLLESVVVAWQSTDVPPMELAGIVLGAGHAYHVATGVEVTELVWSGPSSEFVSTRRTEQALIELITSSTHDLFMVSFVAYEVPSVTKALNEAADKGVNISFLVEASEKRGGQVKDDCAGRMKKSLPTAKVYTWSETHKRFIGGGYMLVHAKCAVADNYNAFISSANLSTAAMEKNMELGILIKGGKIPEKLHKHLDSLVTTGIIERA